MLKNPSLLAIANLCYKVISLAFILVDVLFGSGGMFELCATTLYTVVWVCLVTKLQDALQAGSFASWITTFYLGIGCVFKPVCDEEFVVMRFTATLLNLITIGSRN